MPSKATGNERKFVGQAATELRSRPAAPLGDDAVAFTVPFADTLARLKVTVTGVLLASHQLAFALAEQGYRQ